MSVNSTKNLTVNVALSACSQASQWSSHPYLAKRFSDSRANSQQTANFRPKFQTHELACVAAFTLLFQVERSIQRAKEERNCGEVGMGMSEKGEGVERKGFCLPSPHPLPLPLILALAISFYPLLT